jgi:putative ABC transport system ATP-binding protein
MEQQREVAIQCRGIKKIYGKGETRVEALRGIDLDIYKGELTLLVGPSGSGKTTLLSIITTILSHDEGELSLLGRDTSKMSENDKADFSRNNLGIVFQSLFLMPTLTVTENVIIPLLISGFDEEVAEVKAHEVLKRLNIDHRSETPPANLSKGQQQRVAIARAMVHDSKILVCDEPTSSLDQPSGMEVMKLLHELAQTKNMAVLVVTHDHRMFPIGDRIIHMSDGQIQKDKNNENHE